MIERGPRRPPADLLPGGAETRPRDAARLPPDGAPDCPPDRARRCAVTV